MTNYFPSARSWVLGGIIWGILSGVFGFSLCTVIAHFSLTDLIIILSIFFILFLFFGIIWFRTGYFISKGYLIIKIGAFTHSRVRISSISKILRSNSVLSSPANSLNRLSIKYGRKGLVLISPKDEAGFLTAIKEENSNVIVDI